MKIPLRPILRPAFLAALFTVVAGTLTIQAARDEKPVQPEKLSSLPQPEYASDEERMAAEQAAARQVDPAAESYARDFAQSGADFRSLPSGPGMEFPVATWGPSLAEAVKGAAGVVRGRVGRQVIGDDYIESTIQVSEWLVGGSKQPEIKVRQFGGPALVNGEGTLVQLRMDPILFAEHEYILFLTRCEPLEREAAEAENFYCTRLWGRQFVVEAGTIQTVFEHEQWTTAAQGMRPEDFASLVKEEALKAGR
jgi:hypothetical protein